MSKQPNSKQTGVLKKEMTAIPQDLPFTNAENLSTSDILGTTARATSQKASQLTPNSPPNAEFRLIHALAGKLGKKVEWKKIILTDGRAGWMLFFDVALWEVSTNGKSSELVIRS